MSSSFWYINACAVDFKFVGSFSGNVGLDGHLLFTYSAIQILTILDELNAENIDADATVNCILASFLNKIFLFD